MIDFITSLTGWKLYVVLALVALYPAAFFGGDLWGRHKEKLIYYKANNALVQAQAKQDKKETTIALEKEKALATDLEKLEAAKAQVQEKIDELSKDDVCSNSKLSEPERVYLQSLIDAANK